MTVRLTVAQALVRFLANQYSERDGVRAAADPGLLRHLRARQRRRRRAGAAGGARAPARRTCPTTWPATSRAWCTPRSASPGCATGCRRWPAPRRSGPARRTCSPAPRWPPPTGSRCCCCPATCSPPGWRARCCRSWRSPRGYDVSVNDAFRPLSRFFDRVWRPEQLPAALLGAMRVLTDPAETGAVTIALPQDVQAEAYDWPDELFAKRVWHVARPVPEPAALARAVERDPGGAAAAADRRRRGALREATDALRRVRRGHRHPGGRHPGRQGRAAAGTTRSAVGGVGSTGTPVANALARDADVVIGVGTRYSDFTTASRTAFQHPDVRFVNLNVAALRRGQARRRDAAWPTRAPGLEALTEALAGYRVENTWSAHRRRRGTRASTRPTTSATSRCPRRPRCSARSTRSCDARDVVVQAAGSMPGDLQMLWRARDPKQYHVEYAYSCMGYEIAGALGIKMAAPDREVFALVGDGSYLMMAQEIVTAVSEGIKLNVVLVQNHGFASIGALSESLGSQRFGTSYRYRDPDTGQLDGATLPVDLAANAESLGADVIRVPHDRGVPRRRSRAPARPTGPPRSTSRPTRWPRCPSVGELVGRAGLRGRPRSTAPSRPARPTRRTRPTQRPLLAPAPRRDSRVRTVTHWIGGKPATGSVHPHQRRCGTRPPASSRPRCVLASTADVDAAVQTAAGGVRDAGRSRRCRSAPRCCSPSASWSTHRDRRARRDHLRRARQGPLRRPRRGAARPGGGRVRLRHPDRCSRASYSDQVSTGVDVFSFRAAARRRAPGSPRSTSRRWCRCGCTRWPSPAATPSCSSPASATRRASLLVAELWAEAGLPDGVFNVVHGDKEAVDALLDHPDVAAVSFVGSTPIAQLHPRARHRERQAGAGPRRREEPRDRAAGRRPRLRLRPPGRRRVRLGGRALHGDLGGGRRRVGAATSWSPRSARRRAPSRSAPAATPDSEMGPVVTAAAPDRIVGLIGTGAEQGADARRRRPRAHRARPRERLLRRPDGDRQGHPGDGRLPRGDLRPGAVGGARRHGGRGDRADQRQPVRQRHRDLHLLRRGGAAVPARGERRDDRHQRADPGADGLLLLRRLEGLAVRRQAHPRAGGRLVLHPGQGRHLPVAARRARRAAPATTSRRRAEVMAVLDRLTLGTAPDSWGVWFADRPAPGRLAAVPRRDRAGRLHAGPSWARTGFLPQDPAQLRDELDARGLHAVRRHDLRRAAPRRRGARARRSRPAAGSRGCSPRSARGIWCCCPSSTPTCTPAPSARVRASIDARAVEEPHHRLRPARASSCTRSSASSWCSTRTPTPTSTPRSGSSGSSPTPTRSSSTCASTPGTSPTAAATTSPSSSGSPSGSATSTSSRSTPPSRARVRAEKLSLAEAVPLGRDGRAALRRARHAAAARRARPAWTPTCSPSSSRTSTRSSRTSRCRSAPAPPATSEAAASGRSGGGPTDPIPQPARRGRLCTMEGRLDEEYQEGDARVGGGRGARSRAGGVQQPGRGAAGTGRRRRRRPAAPSAPSATRSRWSPTSSPATRSGTRSGPVPRTPRPRTTSS